MRRRRIAWTAAGLLVVAAGQGCQTAGPASWTLMDNHRGDFSYVAGRASRTFAAPPTTVLPAVRAAMDDLRVQSLRQINEQGTIILEATTADNRNATITLIPGTNGTRMNTKIGMLGDEPLSRALSDRIGIHLGGPTTTSPSSSPSPTAESTQTTSTSTRTTPVGNPYFSRTAVSDQEILKGSADGHFQDHPTP